MSGPTTFEPVRGTVRGKRAQGAPPPGSFEDFWNAYPPTPNKGSRPLAEDAFGALVETGEDPDALVRAARAHGEAQPDPNRRYAAWRFLADDHWRHVLESLKPLPDAEPDPRLVLIGRVKRYMRTQQWDGEGPAPGQAGCAVPAEILQAAGFDPQNVMPLKRAGG